MRRVLDWGKSNVRGSERGASKGTGFSWGRKFNAGEPARGPTQKEKIKEWEELSKLNWTTLLRGLWLG